LSDNLHLIRNEKSKIKKIKFYERSKTQKEIKEIKIKVKVITGKL